MLGNLIGGFIVILIGVNLIPTVANSIVDAQYGTNLSTQNGSVTGTAGTLLDLTTLFFAIGVMAAGVSLGVGGLRNAGLL
jgi:hypothetical protein